MGCEKFQMTPGIFSTCVHGGDERFLVLVKDGAPSFLGLEVDEVFGVEEAGGVGAVVGADLADDLCDFGEAGKRMRASSMSARFEGAGGGGERAADPDGAFVEVRKELGADAPGDHGGMMANSTTGMAMVTKRCSTRQRTATR